MNLIRLRLCAGLAAAVAVVACGGGGDDRRAADPLQALPSSASQSAAGLVNYLGSLPPLDAEMREPLSVEGFNPPTPDDTEPQSVGG